MPPPPDTAYAPGTQLTVGSHKVKIIKYLSSGGFADVYTCSIDPPYHGQTIGCLKRVQVPNKMQLNLLRQEVDAMKRLKGNKCIVSYIDSHASRLQSNSPVQQYEVCLLMEYCPRNGLIDLMNTRLQHKLTEPEILVIMRDITTGVSMCHHLQPPLLHRDIKIENVLIDKDGNYKLCDFGSAVGYKPVPRNPKELQELRDDIMHYTTPQYRAPEMIDLTRNFPIDDKSDVWALGCLLYKLCYYITPFERPHHSSLQDLENDILRADSVFKFPPDLPGSTFSPRLKNIITVCLREDPRRRPNADQLLGEICSMLGQSIPDVIPYTLKHHSMSRLQSASNMKIPPKLPSTPSINSPSLYNEKKLPEIHAPSIQPPKQDPFASIDKSKLLKHKYQSPYLSVSQNGRYSNSSTSLKENLQKQINESKHDVDIMRKSEELNRDTLDFLRSKQHENQTGQNTGGSIKSFKSGFLRKISTGGLSANGTGDSLRRSSVSSIKQILTGGSSRKVSNNNEDSSSQSKQQNETPNRKLSIKKRMAMLMKNSEPVKKTAQGYGKYTDSSDKVDIDAINSPVSAGAYSSLSSSSSSTSSYNNVEIVAPSKGPSVPKALKTIDSKSKKFAPSTSPKETKPSLGKQMDSIELKKRLSNIPPKKKVPPPKPAKPAFLKAPPISSGTPRKLSTGSDLSIPDIDDLEKQFSKRFPSRVL